MTFEGLSFDLVRKKKRKKEEKTSFLIQAMQSIQYCYKNHETHNVTFLTVTGYFQDKNKINKEHWKLASNISQNPF